MYALLTIHMLCNNNNIARHTNNVISMKTFKHELRSGKLWYVVFFSFQVSMYVLQ